MSTSHHFHVSKKDTSSIGAPRSFITPHGFYRSICGYCHSHEKTSVNYGSTAQRLDPEDYEWMMLNGWRRSGVFCYKPIVERTCCPPYSIRLPLAKFHLSSSQKRVLKRMAHFLRGQDEHRPGECGFQERMKEILNSPPNWKHRLRVELKIPEKTESLFELFCRYQRLVHHDEKNLTPQRFAEFLVESPLVRVPRKDVGEQFFPTHCGTYHQLYFLDNVLIACGVLDIIPLGLSSVYFFYEPELGHLSLGTLGALIEIYIASISSDLEYYYMGYYIENCAKMRYKASYRESELRDPFTGRFIEYSKCSPYLENGFGRLDIMNEEQEMPEKRTPISCLYPVTSQSQVSQMNDIFVLVERQEGWKPLKQSRYRVVIQKVIMEWCMVVGIEAGRFGLTWISEETNVKGIE